MPWNNERDLSSRIRGAGDLQLSADTVSPLAHSLQPIVSVFSLADEQLRDPNPVVAH